MTVIQNKINSMNLENNVNFHHCKKKKKKIVSLT